MQLRSQAHKKRQRHEIDGEALVDRPEVTKRRPVDPFQLSSHFEKLIELKAEQKKQPPKASAHGTSIQLVSPSLSPHSSIGKALGLKCQRRRTSLETQTLVIFLRFGSINSDEN